MFLFVHPDILRGYEPEVLPEVDIEMGDGVCPGIAAYQLLRIGLELLQLGIEHRIAGAGREPQAPLGIFLNVGNVVVQHRSTEAQVLLVGDYLVAIIAVQPVACAKPDVAPAALVDTANLAVRQPLLHVDTVEHIVRRALRVCHDSEQPYHPNAYCSAHYFLFA